MHFAVLPPEVNSGRMYDGLGEGPMLTAASAWDELANEGAAKSASQVTPFTSPRRLLGGR